MRVKNKTCPVCRGDSTGSSLGHESAAVAGNDCYNCNGKGLVEGGENLPVCGDGYKIGKLNTTDIGPIVWPIVW